jgi:hypothetical protein
MSDLNKAIVTIAGNNAIGVNSDDVHRMCRALSYLRTQLWVQMNSISDDKELVKQAVSAVEKNAAEILNT